MRTQASLQPLLSFYTRVHFFPKDYTRSKNCEATRRTYLSLIVVNRATSNLAVERKPRVNRHCCNFLQAANVATLNGPTIASLCTTCITVFSGCSWTPSRGKHVGGSGRLPCGRICTDSVFHMFGERAGAGICGYAQPSWEPECSLPELPHAQCMAADPGSSGIRSQSDQVPIARYAPVGELYRVSHETGIHQRWPALPRLPRRYSPPANGSKLRTVPHGPGLARFCPADPAAQ